MYLKFCGFRYEDDVKKAIEYDIDAIGFIHFSKSRRHLEINQIQHLSALVPETLQRVVVVVNPNKQQIQQLVTLTNIDTIQFHGNENIEFIKWVKQQYPNIKIFKALPATQDLNSQLELYKPYVDLFIIDTPSTKYGGTGQTFDWNLIKHIEDTPFLIAGGLNDEYIKTIQHMSLNHLGYDIASGIETNEQKDKRKMKTIFNIVKGE
ncbi:phosphoribosylanthranilate isomerase [Staphylococcus pasteuri]|uniref:phosphoribosylanthranilate isomerase n=1 Tax=Staphylococcus pasteuri TaxID=45972 RepID=UPI000E38338B|nr:phosphoribosylanthranilate isomerase [Staphylococcus pasteuri]RFD71086.1 phosphoribosylanthranilate isomerase [Staphylococcus pasteuri]